MPLSLFSDQPLVTRGVVNAGATQTISAVLYDDDGSAVDLTGATVEFWLRAESTRRFLVQQPATVADPPTSGAVSYDLDEYETSYPGTYAARFVVDHADGTRTTYPGRGWYLIHVIGTTRQDTAAAIATAVAAAKQTAIAAAEAEAYRDELLALLENLELGGLAFVTSDTTLNGDGTPNDALTVLNSPKLGGQLPDYFRNLANVIGTLALSRVRGRNAGTLLTDDLDTLFATDAAQAATDTSLQSQIDGLTATGASALSIVSPMGILFDGETIGNEFESVGLNNDSAGVVANADGTYTIPVGDYIERDVTDPAGESWYSDPIAFMVGMYGANIGGLIVKVTDVTPDPDQDYAAATYGLTGQEEEGGIAYLQMEGGQLGASGTKFRIENDGTAPMTVSAVLQFRRNVIPPITAVDARLNSVPDGELVQRSGSSFVGVDPNSLGAGSGTYGTALSVTTNRSLTSADDGRALQIDDSLRTITVPKNATTALNYDRDVEIEAGEAGATISAEDANVTINNITDASFSLGAGDVGVLRQKATDEWSLTVRYRLVANP